MADNYGKFLAVLKKPKVLIGVFIFSTVFIIYWRPTFITTPTIKYWNNIKFAPDATIYQWHRKPKIKYILYWNTFFGAKDMYFGTGSRIFEKCPVRTCFATTNKTFMPVEYFDAVIFHGPRYSVYSDGIPKKRSIHQKYIFYSLESPFNTNFDSASLVNFYNWTMTYRRDSDIFRPYSLIEKKQTKYVLPNEEDLKNKTKQVAWFVSNCKNGGAKKRMDYAKELQKYIPIDIYGACGKLSCQNSTACYKMLERDYKFYLSFENSMCKDYITEKMFNILQYNVVPVVLGYSDYNANAPPYSVINTQDYLTPKELADYLWQLHQNGKQYLKYFEWKKSYVVSSSTHSTLCQLCELLNKPLTYSSYGNIKDWFYGFTCLA